MAATHITASGNVTVETGHITQAMIQVNAALTGSITVKDGANTVAVITNPTVGTQYEYWDFATNMQVNPSTTCDITVNVNGRLAPM